LCYCRRRSHKRSAALSIAEYCNRSYNSASTSNVHDAVFSVHFSSTTGDVHLPTPHDADDRQRLDADFNVAATEDDDICPYATFSDIKRQQTARRDVDYETAALSATGDGQPVTDGVDATTEQRQTSRSRKTKTRDDTSRRLEPHRRPAVDNDLTTLYAQPHKLIAKDSASFTTGDRQHVQTEKLFDNV